MPIQIKFGGELKRYASGASDMRSFEPDGPISVARTLEQIGVDEEADEILVIVNDEVVPPGRRAEVTLGDGDRLTLMPQLKGG